ncbi:thiamine phosphate synthase [Alteromonadaceae bacterium M269]|nr:thiamine phosphate synthase [Alteromonadaceae bacterium M269]
MINSRFYLIVDHTDWLKRLLPLGVKLVQLRIKDKATDVVAQQIEKAKALCEQYGAQLIVNDYWRIAIDKRCDFVHLGQEDLEAADVELIKQSGLKLGISTHSQSELDYAMSFKPDYIALGPIYETKLKKMKYDPQGLDELTQWKQQIGDTPLVAIGGMTPERARLSLNAGADSVAVVTDILLNPSPELRTQEWLKI